ncbi:hypothetical protein ACK2M7_00115 [Chryseobacterium sp. TY4]
MENEVINYINSHHLIWINGIREKSIFTQKQLRTKAMSKKRWSLF